MRLPSSLTTALLILWPLAVSATVVSTVSDEDNGSLGGGNGVSLREAVKYSPAGEIITFSPKQLSGQTIRLTLGQITIDRALTIDGSSLPSPITLSGDKTGNGRTSDDTLIFTITGGTVLLESLILDRGNNQYGGAIHVNNLVTRLTIRNSTISNSGGGTHGGGIYFIGGSKGMDSFLTIQKCSFTGNSVGHDGGAIHMSGILSIEDSTFSNNIAFQGGALFHGAGTATVQASSFTGGGATYTSGGAIFNQATLTLQESTISGNVASTGGGIHHASGTLTLQDSTVSGNTASTGGGIHHSSGALTIGTSTLSGNTASSQGGGIHVKAGTLISRNSTYSGNKAGLTGGAVGALGGTLTFQNCTISANTAAETGGGTGKTIAALTFTNTIVAGNFAADSPNTYSHFTSTNSLTSGIPLLAPLGDYGGPTQTMPPLPGSPAIYAGGSTALLTDQRGFHRAGAPDIGAAEYQDTPDLVRYWQRDFDSDGVPFGVEQAVGADPLLADAHLSLAPPVPGPTGHPVLSFGLNPAILPGTNLVLRRSPSLSPADFVIIYRYDGDAEFAAPGITHQRSASLVTLTDTNPPPGAVFYRLEAVLDR